MSWSGTWWSWRTTSTSAAGSPVVRRPTPGRSSKRGCACHRCCCRPRACATPSSSTCCGSNVRIPDIFLSDLQAQSGERDDGRSRPGRTGGPARPARLPGRTDRAHPRPRPARPGEANCAPGRRASSEFEDVEEPRPGSATTRTRIRVRVTVRDGRIGLELHRFGRPRFQACRRRHPVVHARARRTRPCARWSRVRSRSNAGFLERIDVDTRPAGSVLDASFPAGVAARGVLGYRVIEVVYGALAAALPEPGAGGRGRERGLVGRPVRRGPGRPAVPGQRYWSAGPGVPARHGDGVDGAGRRGGRRVQLGRPQRIERDDPLRVLAYGFVCDSGGVGRRRGGSAVRRVLEVDRGGGDAEACGQPPQASRHRPG